MEQTVIARCLEGDRKAQYEVYQAYAKAMYNICLRLTNDEQDAEDVLQDAFVSAFSNLGSYKGEASFGAWLKRIVVNHSINFLKKKRMAFMRIDDHDYTELEERNDQVDDSRLVMQVDAIRQAITQLPDGFRVIFSLYLLEGYDHYEIADILKITPSTSKTQYMRAKNKLKELLAGKAVRLKA